MDNQDEINLYDIWQTLVTHKVVFWISFFIVFSTGIFFSLTKQPIYEYSQLVEIAGYTNSVGNNINLISPDTEQTRIIKFYLPKILKEYKYQHPDNKQIFDENQITITKNGDSNLMLSIQGSKLNFSLYQEIVNRIIDKMTNNIAPAVNTRKEYLINYLNNLQNQLNQENQTNALLSELITSKRKNDALNVRAGNIELMQRVFAINSYRENIVDLLEKISSLKLEKETLHESRAASELMVSKDPIGPTISTMIILSLVLAFFAGFITVLITNFFYKINIPK